MKDKCCALIGLDGSGKSANLELLKKDSSFSDVEFLWVRWEPTLLKPLYNILNKREKNRKTQVEPSGERPTIDSSYQSRKAIKSKVFSNPLIRRGWLFMATLDYTIQYYRKVGKYLLKKRPIIYDRFYLDLYIDQGINLGYSVEQIEKEISNHSWVFPKLDKYIYIRVRPAVCYARKDDIPNMEYLEKRYAIYEHLSKSMNWIIIDGEMPLENVFDAIKKELL